MTNKFTTLSLERKDAEDTLPISTDTSESVSKMAVSNNMPASTPGKLSEKERYLKQVLGTRFTDETTIRPMAVAITIAGSTFARRGDFSVVTGQRKAGKTTILHYVAATALHNPDDTPLKDTLQIETAYCEGKAVIYIDTEGSQEDTKDFMEAVKRILGLDKMPSNFYVYHWRNMTQKECKSAMEVLFEYHTQSHLWIIDGIADLVSKPNDEEESNSTVRWVMNNAGRLDACFVLVIHENPQKHGQESKARGHLGSELERKASGAIGVEKHKEDKCHYIRSRFLRKSADFEPIGFWWQDGQPVSRVLSAMEKEQIFQKGYERIKDLRQLIKNCFYGVSSKTEKEFKNSVVLYQLPSPSKEAARKKQERNIKAMIDHNLLVVSQDDQGNVVYSPISETQSEQPIIGMD